MSVNYIETYFISFFSYTSSLLAYNQLNIHFQNEDVVISSVRVIIDSDLRWNHHVENVIKKKQKLTVPIQTTLLYPRNTTSKNSLSRSRRITLNYGIVA